MPIMRSGVVFQVINSKAVGHDSPEMNHSIAEATFETLQLTAKGDSMPLVCLYQAIGEQGFLSGHSFCITLWLPPAPHRPRHLLCFKCLSLYLIYVFLATLGLQVCCGRSFL